MTIITPSANSTIEVSNAQEDAANTPRWDSTGL
jgi:hypothetical protein